MEAITAKMVDLRNKSSVSARVALAPGTATAKDRAASETARVSSYSGSTHALATPSLSKFKIKVERVENQRPGGGGWDDWDRCVILRKLWGVLGRRALRRDIA